MSNFSILSAGAVIPEKDELWVNEIPKAMKRRAPRIWRMAHVATERALKDTQISPKSIITATALGALDETVGFLNGSFTDGFGSPRNFIASVHNSMAGNLAMSFGIKGPNLTVCDSHNSLASSIVSAGFLTEKDFPLLLVMVDERTELLDELNKDFSKECKDFLPQNWTEGAVSFLIDKADKSDVNISADGPKPTKGLQPKDLLKATEHHFTEQGYELQPLEISSNSFIAPAILLHDYLNNNSKNNIIIPAYSPTSKAISFIKVKRA